MKIDQLQYFLEAAKHQHIGKAAKAVAISPSAISHAISLLEEELGRELFVKRGKHIRLTNHGQLLREKAQALLQDIEKIKEQMQAEEVEPHGHYRLAASHVLCSEVLAPAWAKLQRDNSKLSGELFSRRSAEVVQGIASGEWDLGLCFSPQDHPEVVKQTLYTGQLRVVLAQDHPLWDKPPSQRLSYLSHYPCVLPKPFQGVDVCQRHPVFDRFGIQLQVASLFDSYEVASQLVALSHSWSFFPDFLLTRHKALRGLACPPGWHAPYTLCTLWSLSRGRTAATKRLIPLLLERLPKTPGTAPTVPVPARPPESGQTVAKTSIPKTL